MQYLCDTQELLNRPLENQDSIRIAEIRKNKEGLYRLVTYFPKSRQRMNIIATEEGEGEGEDEKRRDAILKLEFALCNYANENKYRIRNISRN